MTASPRARRASLGLAVFLAVAGAAFAQAPHPASGQDTLGTWSRPVRLSAAGGLASDVQIAAGPRGEEVGVWAELRGSGADSRVMAAQRPGCGKWSLAVPLSPAGQIVLSPDVAVSASGMAVAVWVVAGESSGHQPPFVQAAVRRPGSRSWSRPTRISPVGADAGQAVVGIGGGRAIAVWETYGKLHNRIEASTLAPSTSDWSRPAVLEQARQQLLAPQIAVDARGDAIVAWRQWTGQAPPRHEIVTARIIAATRPAGHRSWATPAGLGPEYEPADQGVASPQLPGPRVAIGGRGQAIVAWQGWSHGHIVTIAALRDAGGRWHQPQPVAATPALSPDAAMDSAGDTTVVWQGRGGSVQAATRPAAGERWSVSRQLYRGKPGIDPYPQIASAANGEAIATWSGDPVRAAVHPSLAAAWQPAVTLGPGGQSQSAISPSGNGVVAWQQPAPKDNGMLVEAASYAAALRCAAQATERA